MSLVALQDTDRSGRKGTSRAAFEREARVSLVAVRSAFEELLVSLALPKRKPVELQRMLGIDYRLAWQVVNVAGAEDAILGGKHVPQASSVRRLLAAAGERGVKGKVLESVLAASVQFEALMARHAEDRTSFDAMLASLLPRGDDGEEAISLTMRRNAYRLNSSIWGVQVGTFWTATVVKPAAEGEAKGLHVAMKRGLRRLRADAPILVERSRSDVGPASVLPVDREAFARHGAALLPEFCSRPTPKLRQEMQADGWKNSLLADTAVGRSSTVDLTFAKLAVAAPGEEEDEEAGVVGSSASRSTAYFVTPAEVAVIDLLLHKSSRPVRPWVKVFSSSDVFKRGRGTTEVPVLPVALPIVAETVGMKGLAHRAIPKAEAVVRHACGLVGWDADEFSLYRVQMEYPVLHSVLWFQLDRAE